MNSNGPKGKAEIKIAKIGLCQNYLVDLTADQKTLFRAISKAQISYTQLNELLKFEEEEKS